MQSNQINMLQLSHTKTTWWNGKDMALT